MGDMVVVMMETWYISGRLFPRTLHWICFSLLAVWISLGGYAGMGKWEAIAAWHGVYQQYLASVNKDTL
jgi:hypothetical protein